MLKCISVASANDACTAMAEYIAGSEEAFVKMMNERAAGLGMKIQKPFQNCNGLGYRGTFDDGKRYCSDVQRIDRKISEDS